MRSCKNFYSNGKSCSKVELFTPVTVFLDTSDDEHQSRENSLEGHNVKEKTTGRKETKALK